MKITDADGLEGRTTRLVVVDWGTTRLRAWLVAAEAGAADVGPGVAGPGVDPDRAVVEERRESGAGIATLGRGEHERALLGTIAPWTARHGPLPVVALGMVGSRDGWAEVPYVPCPADPAALAAGVLVRRLASGAPLYLLPGLVDTDVRPFPDVMRGEETQIVGAGELGTRTLVLPGTHAKWVRVGAGGVERFRTFVTGELFALLRARSFVARSGTRDGQGAVPDEAAPDGEVVDEAAFRRGVDVSAETSSSADATLALLFSVRTGRLAGRIAPEAAGDYLSGLLIGQEFRQARGQGWFAAGDTLGLIGGDALLARYALAADAFGLDTVRAPADAALRGALTIAARLIDEPPVRAARDTERGTPWT